MQDRARAECGIMRTIRHSSRESQREKRMERTEGMGTLGKGKPLGISPESWQGWTIMLVVLFSTVCKVRSWLLLTTKAHLVGKWAGALEGR